MNEDNKVGKGLRYISNILKKVEKFSKESEFKDMGRFVFRGISK